LDDDESGEILPIGIFYVPANHEEPVAVRTNVVNAYILHHA
jgi:hypothetical protein